MCYLHMIEYMHKEKESESFLFEYLNNTSPTGYETDGQKIWLSYLDPYIDDRLTDTYGTAVGIINPQASYKVVIAAHADEVSWFVNYITQDGYIYVIRNGGSDYQIAPSQRAKVHTEKGAIAAVFGWPAIHVREDKEKTSRPDVEKIILDCGCNSAEEIESLGIHVGSVVTFDADLAILNQNFLVGRGLDNRIGGFIIAEVVRRIHERKQKLPFGLYIVNAVQEEVGLNGAAMIAHRLKPDLAIVTDVTHDTQSPLYNKIKEGDIACSKGPVLSYAPPVQRNVLKMLIEVAKNHEIPFQRQASSGRTGTDADAFAYTSVGVASGLISLPLKYMHTTVEMAHRKDIEHIIALMYSFLLQLNPEHSFDYFE